MDASASTCIAMTPTEQARHYLQSVDPSISGNGGHNKTFHTAYILVQEFGLPITEARPLMIEYNARCQPPWTEKEIDHKLADAERKAPPPEGRGYRISKRFRHTFKDRSNTRTAPPAHRPLPPVNATKELKVAARKYECSDELVVPDPLPNGTVELIKAAFKQGEGVRIAKAKTGEDGRENPKDAGTTLSREEWLKRLADNGGDINNFIASSERNGIYVGLNPMKIGGSKDSDVTDYRHALVEWDDISKEEQWNIITQSGVPCTAVIDSGGKSLHAWVRIDAQDRQEFDSRVKVIYQHFEVSGVKLDDKNKNPSRLSRLAGCVRGKNRQELLALNIGAESFTEWVKKVEADEIGPCRRISELLSLDTSKDPNCVIGFREGKTLRYLCKGKSAWLIGPSGVGKSSLVTDFAIGWAFGKPVFGIEPAKPLKSLIIQAENDDYDLAEMVQGIARAHDITNHETAELLDERVLFRTETTCVGFSFIDRLHRLIDRERPDVVWVDPLLSFAGIDVAKQDQVTEFLRIGLNPVLEATGVVFFGAHHTGKPKNLKETQSLSPIEHAYAGIGSSELVNWARAVMVLRQHDHRFELRFAKRGPRAGAKQPNGDPATINIWIEHAKQGIGWVQVEPPYDSKSPKQEGEKKQKKDEQIAAMNLHSFLSSCPVDGESLRKISTRLELWLCEEAKFDAKNTTCRNTIPLLVSNGKIIKKGADKEAKYFKGPNA